MTTESIRVEITASNDTTHVDHYLTTFKSVSRSAVCLEWTQACKEVYGCIESMSCRSWCLQWSRGGSNLDKTNTYAPFRSMSQLRAGPSCGYAVYAFIPLIGPSAPDFKKQATTTSINATLIKLRDRGFFFCFKKEKFFFFTNKKKN